MAASKMKYESKSGKGKEFKEAPKKAMANSGTGRSAGKKGELKKMSGKGHSKHHKMK